MAGNSFEKVILEYLNSDKSAVADFIRTSFSKSDCIAYKTFLDDFLLKRGIISFNSIPDGKGNKFMPYLNCAEKNIFGKKKV